MPRRANASVISAAHIAEPLSDKTARGNQKLPVMRRNEWIH
jgi:hypothetical protein